MCQDCIKHHMLEKNLPFEINCRPIRSDAMDFGKLIDGFMAQGMDDQEALWSAYKIHIPQFARDILDLPAWHPVQDDLFMCNATRIVGRVHRRAGKTVGSRVKVVHRCMFTDTTVLVVAPYEDQIDEFFGGENGGLEDIILRAAKKNPWILDWVVKPKASKSGRLFRVKPRYKMDWVTGAIVQGKVLRSTNSKRGSSARGLGVVGLRNIEDESVGAEDVAGMVVLDESDYLELSDWATINPIIEQNPNVESIEMSTPAGKREAYHSHCVDSPGHREIFYPITKRPDIAALEGEEQRRALEKIRRTCQSEDEYVREWLAGFGLASASVFRPEDLQACSGDHWEYSLKAETDIFNCPVREKPKDGRIRTLGVDWNRPGVGVRIYVCEFTPGGTDGRGFYKFMDRLIVANVEFTQLSAADAIICANRLWRPEFIYCDAGFGDTQIEKLKLFGLQAREEVGFQHPDAKLPFIVKAINMQETIPVPDPAEPNNKDKARKISEKALMVSFYQAISQERAVFFSQVERMPGNLIPAMNAFKVERINPSGHPVYTGEADHDIVASGLALYAFWKEYHYTKGRSILETAALISGRGLDDELPSRQLLPKFRDGMVRRAQRPADEDSWGALLHKGSPMDGEPDERHLVKTAVNGRPVHQSAAIARMGRGGGFTSRASGFSRRSR